MKRRYQSIFLFVGLLVFGQCEYKDVRPTGSIVTADCSQSLLAITVESKTDATACNLINGNIAVTASAGTAPYAFSINGGDFQTNASFANLGPGTYTLAVKDGAQCQRSISVDISSPDSKTTVTIGTSADNNCLSPDGTIILTPHGSTRPYAYQFGTGSFGTDSVFSNLKFGNYTVIVRDAGGCPLAINVTVPRGQTGVSYLNVIKPIITTNCAISGCHNGDNGASRNWTILANLQNNAQNVKLRTGNRSMPLTGSLTQDQINLIACWVDDGALNN
jgi:hypothetical protein